MTLSTFRTVFPSVIRSSGLYIQQQAFVKQKLLSACWQAVSKPVWHIPLPRVQWKTPDDGQRNCSKHVEFSSKNKFEKLVHLVGFIIRIPRLHLTRRHSFHPKISILHRSCYSNVATSPLGTGRGSLRIRGAHFGNYCFRQMSTTWHFKVFMG